jgi:hypothetical protein
MVRSAPRPGERGQVRSGRMSLFQSPVTKRKLWVTDETEEVRRGWWSHDATFEPVAISGVYGRLTHTQAQHLFPPLTP